MRPATLLLLLILSLSVAAATDAICDYGLLPGFYRDNRWQAVDSACPLEGYVEVALKAQPSTHNISGYDVSVLIFGDSVERITLHDLCEQGQYENWGHAESTFHTCRRGSVLLSRQSMIGVHPVPSFNLTGSPFQRIAHVSAGLWDCIAFSAGRVRCMRGAACHWRQGFARHVEVTGRQPDAVVYSSVLWDLQRWSQDAPGVLASRSCPTQPWRNGRSSCLPSSRTSRRVKFACAAGQGCLDIQELKVAYDAGRHG